MTWSDERRRKASERLRLQWANPDWAARQRSVISKGFRESPGNYKPHRRKGSYQISTYLDGEVRHFLIDYARKNDLSLTDTIERAIIHFLGKDGYDV